MPLKPQDLLVILKLCSLDIAYRKKELKTLIQQADLPGNWTFRSLSKSLSLSLSQINASIDRGLKSKLLVKPTNRQKPKPILPAVIEFVIHGARYAFPAEIGGTVRGIVTAYASDAMAEEILNSQELPPVWAFSGGDVRGFSVTPLYKSVPRAALEDDTLYDLLALLDAIRIGRARERAIAISKIKALIE